MKKQRGSRKGCFGPIAFILVSIILLIKFPAAGDFLAKVINDANQARVEEPVQVNPKWLQPAEPAEKLPDLIPISYSYDDYSGDLAAESLGTLSVVDVWDGDPAHRPVRFIWDFSVERNKMSVMLDPQQDGFSFLREYAEDGEGNPGFNLNFYHTDGYTYQLAISGNFIEYSGTRRVAVRALYGINCRVRKP